MEKQHRPQPDQYDGTQFLVFVELPQREWTTADLYEHVYGVRLDDGAKPWPYFRDARTKEWYSLSTAEPYPTDALVWMIDLQQLAYKPLDKAQDYLEEVIPELMGRAAKLGGSVQPASSIPDALAKMGRVQELLAIRDYEVRIVVTAPNEGTYDVAQWWQALEEVGLVYGDGDLFWLYNKSNSEPYELFCAEPFSQSGYFHPADRGSNVRFSDVSLFFRAREAPDPIALLRRMAEVAEHLAARLGAVLLTENGQPFDRATSEERLLGVALLAALSSLWNQPHIEY